MARTRITSRVSPQEVLRKTPWPTSTIWKAEDLPAQLTPENFPDIVYSLQEVRATPWGLQGRYGCPGEAKKRDAPTNGHDLSPEDIWLPILFPDLRDPSSGIAGIQVEDIVRGHWIQDRTYRSQHGSWGVPLGGWRAPIRRQGSPPEPLPLPQDYVMQAFSVDYEDAVSRAVNMEVVGVPDSELEPGQRGRGMFDQLPVELMREIVGYLVPVGCTYNFFVADRRDIYLESHSACSVVHQMVPIGSRQKAQEEEGKEDIDWTDDTDSPDDEVNDEVPKEPRHKGSAHMALASVNKTFQELIYARFYGGNTFIFHLSTSPFSRIDLETPCRLNTHWISWSRVLTRNASSPCAGPLGPITARAARYMRDVKLSVVTPSKAAGNMKAMASLGKVVDSAVSLLLSTDKQAQEQLQRQQQQQEPYISLHLQFSTPCKYDSIGIVRELMEPGELETPRFQPNIVTIQAGFNLVTGKMDIGPGTWSAFEGYRLKLPPAKNKLDLALQPLRKLKGLVTDMWTHGYAIPADFLDDIGLVHVERAERLPTCYTPHYSNTCRCTENGARLCPQTLPESGVPTLRWQLEAMGWTFYKARGHTMDLLKGMYDINSDASSRTQTAPVKPPRPRQNIYIPSQFGIGPWEPQ